MSLCLHRSNTASKLIVIFHYNVGDFEGIRDLHTAAVAVKMVGQQGLEQHVRMKYERRDVLLFSLMILQVIFCHCGINRGIFLQNNKMNNIAI